MHPPSPLAALASQLLLFLLIPVLNGQHSTSIYIPGFDPQPVSANIIGVGADGRTTWVLHKGKHDAVETSFFPDFVGTATLVEGPHDVSFTYANSEAQFTIGQKCTFSESSLAICAIVAQGSTATQTELVTRIPIQGGETLAASQSLTPTTVLPSFNASTLGAGSSGGSSLSPSNVAPSQTGSTPTKNSSSKSFKRGCGRRCMISTAFLLSTRVVFMLL